MSKMIKCVIDSIRVSLTNQDRVVVLKQVDAERYLPIFIGLFESESLTIALQGVRTARPLTHNLLLETIKNLNAKLLQVEIIKVEQDVFFAHLVLAVEDRTVYVDCRPSDGLVLMALERVPLYIEENILLTAGIQAEDRKGHDVFSTYYEVETSDKKNSDDLKQISDDLLDDDTGKIKNDDNAVEKELFDFESYIESLDDELDNQMLSSDEIVFDFEDEDDEKPEDDNEDYGGYPKEFFEEGLDDEPLDLDFDDDDDDDDDDGPISLEIEIDLDYDDDDDIIEFSDDDLFSIGIDDEEDEDEDEDEDDNDDDEPYPGLNGDDK